MTSPNFDGQFLTHSPIVTLFITLLLSSQNPLSPLSQAVTSFMDDPLFRVNMSAFTVLLIFVVQKYSRTHKRLLMWRRPCVTTLRAQWTLGINFNNSSEKVRTFCKIKQFYSEAKRSSFFQTVGWIIDFRFLYDVTICAGSKRIGCHRVILAARFSQLYI